MKKLLSLILALCLALCMVGFVSAEEDVPTIKIITLGNGQPDNYEAWITSRFASVSPISRPPLPYCLPMQMIAFFICLPHSQIRFKCYRAALDFSVPADYNPRCCYV